MNFIVHFRFMGIIKKLSVVKEHCIPQNNTIVKIAVMNCKCYPLWKTKVHTHIHAHINKQISKVISVEV